MPGRSEVNKTKKKEVELIRNLIKKYKTVGLINLNNLPSPQLQTARKKLNAEIRVVKKSLLKIAFKGTEYEKLDFCLNEIIPALIMSNDSSFKLAKDLRKGKSFVAAKPGQIAPHDILVKAGPTNLPAGPVIGELGAAGIKASVEQGKIDIRQDSVVVRAGNAISPTAASVLVKLGIKPMEIGLNLAATFEEGNLFGKDVLDIDEKFYIDTLKLAASEALNLSVNIGYVTEDNVELLLRKVESEAIALNKIANAEKDKVINEIASAEKEAEKLAEKTDDQGGN
ncbi:50S ribosomal protein L10 [Candidatus Woesearchaeota archaeon]|nr:50S ribosomal protein L10 [Candidatus Woesearchaeota archaeon]